MFVGWLFNGQQMQDEGNTCTKSPHIVTPMYTKTHRKPIFVRIMT